MRHCRSLPGNSLRQIHPFAVRNSEQKMVRLSTMWCYCSYSTTDSTTDYHPRRRQPLVTVGMSDFRRVLRQYPLHRLEVITFRRGAYQVFDLHTKCELGVHPNTYCLPPLWFWFMLFRKSLILRIDYLYQ